MTMPPDPTPAAAAPGPDGAAPAAPGPARRLRSGLSTVLLWTSMGLLVAMTLLVLFQVFTRYVLGTPAAFTEELVRYALIWVSFLAATYAFLQREHMALTIVKDRLPAGLRRGVGIGIEALVLALAVLVLGIGGAMLAWISRGDISALLGVSRGLVYLIVPIAGIGIALAQVLNLLEAVRAPADAPRPGPAETEEA